jgi:hypothetical protein
VTLAEALVEAAADLPDAEVREVAGGTEWLRDGRPFAAASAASAEFRLSPIVGRAALGTPDVTASPRGGEWVAFRPPELDRFALDRAIAWLGSAFRHAGG